MSLKTSGYLMANSAIYGNRVVEHTATDLKMEDVTPGTSHFPNGGGH
jgi:hypothetical protein